MNTEKEILNKLFQGKWNYAWGKVDEHLISLFYRKGGFHGLYNYIVSEKERMDKDKNHAFSNYYSSDLIETLEKAKTELKDEDFRNYIFESYNISFNKNNFEKLEEFGLLQYFYDFSDSFRGDIVSHHKIGDYSILQTFHKKLDVSAFYNTDEFHTCFNTLEEALIYSIYKGRYYDSLTALLKTIN